jgi:hypothetical protein
MTRDLINLRTHVVKDKCTFLRTEIVAETDSAALIHVRQREMNESGVQNYLSNLGALITGGLVIHLHFAGHPSARRESPRERASFRVQPNSMNPERYSIPRLPACNIA